MEQVDFKKGYGWMLIAASEAHLNEVFDYVMFKKATMPHTAFRYAIRENACHAEGRSNEEIMLITSLFAS